MKEISACSLDCPDACSLVIETDDRGIPHIKGNPSHPFTSGFTCAKIKNFIERLQSPERITHPLLRDGQHWKSISWKVALDLCAEKIHEYRNEPTSILHFHGEGAKGVLKQAGKLFFSMLGATYVRGSLCDAAGYIAYVKDFGSRTNNDITELLNAERIVNWGKDLSRSSIHTAALVNKAHKNGTSVLTISPGGDGNGPASDHSILIRAGTDRLLAAAVIRLFIERNLIQENIIEHTLNWSEFRQSILSKPLDELAKDCDVTRENIEKVFSFYAEEGPAASIIGAGLQRYAYGGENVRFINALALLSGNIGISGGGSYFHLHSLRNVNLDWTMAPKKKTSRYFLMPTIGRNILNAHNPPIRMIWVNGSNVINQAADSNEVARAFEKIDFKVVVDAFMTDTAERADLFLPSTLMLEQEDIIPSYLHDYVNYAKPVLNAPGEAKSDLWILTELGKRLDPPVKLPDTDECFTAALNSPYLDTTLEELRERKFVRARRPRIAYEGLKFDHPGGKYHLPTVIHDEPPPPHDFPLRLLTLIRRDAIHSQILPEKHDDPQIAMISPNSPHMKNIDLKKDVFLVSPLGRLTVRIKMLPGLHPDTILCRRGGWLKLGCGLNQLISADLTDMGNGAPYYQQYVRLENC